MTAVFIWTQKSRVVESARRNILLPRKHLISARPDIVNRELPIRIRRRGVIELAVLAARHRRSEDHVRTGQRFSRTVQCRRLNRSCARTQYDLKWNRLL